MLEVLAAAEKELPRLLLDELAWTGLFIDDHPPTVERLWAPWGDGRVFLHRIFPCAPGEALFHPHPWPSAMLVLAGEYEMAVGYGKGDESPPVAALMIAKGDFRYEMTDPDAWHYVRPLAGPTLSVMVTGKPWGRTAPRRTTPLVALTEEQRAELFALFRGRYPLAGHLTPPPQGASRGRGGPG
jgi:hypothetical protein